jgi:anthranilate/para-aminobenzoate synthase component I
VKAHNQSTYVVVPYKNKLLKLTNLKSGRIYYKDFYLDLVTNKRIAYSINDWLNSLSDRINTYYNYPRVIHLFYEIGFLIESVNLNLINEETILAIDLSFEDIFDYKIKNNQLLHLRKIKEPAFEDYVKRFQAGYDHLLKGNCYQFNLTEEFQFGFGHKIYAEDFIDQLWAKEGSRGRFGSATYIPQMEKLFLSNSPECLFQIRGNELSTMPIKGTIVCEADLDMHEKWQELIADKKCESELFMIADLMRNDLSRIELPISEVVAKKKMLRVPKLLHQYTEIKVHLSDQVTIEKIIKNIFPGGSVTGAPKKRVMEILGEIEDHQRGFYCGSTIILMKEMKAASINIRTAIIDFNKQQLNYKAGGGITLRSDSRLEFEELSYKQKSFIDLLTP